MNHPTRPPQGRTSRRGFTLIEMLTVITILSILMAFLLPAVMRASSNAKLVQVKTELGSFAAAIATFKQEFGIEPPSRIRLHINAAGWNSTDTDTVNSRALIGRMWPQFDFTGSGGGAWSSAVTLTGAECLVFFLGGVTDSSGELIGFSRNPAAPFSNSTGNRLNPFYQFKIDRMIDENSNGFREYRDPLGATYVTPYIYFSSYDGSGYPTEMNSGVWRNVDNANITPLPMSRAYYSTVTGDAAANAATSRPYNPTGYQIICAGFDGRSGPGGAYSKGAPSPLPAWGTFTILNRDVERDNITNFSDGVLVP